MFEKFFWPTLFAVYFAIVVGVAYMVLFQNNLIDVNIEYMIVNSKKYPEVRPLCLEILEDEHVSCYELETFKTAVSNARTAYMLQVIREEECRCPNYINND